MNKEQARRMYVRKTNLSFNRERITKITPKVINKDKITQEKILSELTENDISFINSLMQRVDSMMSTATDAIGVKIAYNITAAYSLIESHFSHEVLTPEEEFRVLELFHTYKLTDEERKILLDFLVLHNLRLVNSVARGYKNYQVNLGELVSQGTIGLIEGIKRFEVSRKNKLSTLAKWWIRQSISRYVHSTVRTIRIPEHSLNDRNRLFKLIAAFELENSRRPSDEELVDLSGFSQERIEELLSLGKDLASLDESVNTESGDSLLDLIPDDTDVSALVEAFFENEELRAAVDKLKDREKVVIERRFGLITGESETLEAIGATLGVTRERIRQIEVEAIKNLRKILSGSVDPAKKTRPDNSDTNQ